MRFLSPHRSFMNAAQVIDALNFSCYRFNRDQGMTAEGLAKLFPTTGAAMEADYQQEKRQQAEAA